MDNVFVVRQVALTDCTGVSFFFEQYDLELVSNFIQHLSSPL